MSAVRYDQSRLSDDDVFLLNEGSHFRLYDKLGAHPATTGDGETGVQFAVFAPAAKQVAVMGAFNDWQRDTHPLRPRANSGIWEGFIPGIEPGALYKYHIHSRHAGYRVDKADPYAFRCQIAPETASVVWDLGYEWGDEDWMRRRAESAIRQAPVSIYEVHLGSWMRDADGGFLSYRELAPRLAAYVHDTGFTHIELMPVMEHPFYGSWGYQCTGYFAPSSRYGTPQDFMFLVDTMHRHGIGVILDWAPAHFPDDAHGLGFFDGTHLYEHEDPRQGIHPEWGSRVFNYGREEVQSFLYSSAFFWAENYHADGIRVDAVTSMLYLDYSRKNGEWVANQYGGNENLEAIAFLRRLNEELYRHFPGFQTWAEEATAWPMVSRPAYLGGLGFGYKWDMGWMHDTLSYLAQDPVYRKFHHDKITFRAVYAFSENYVLPISHDEVVHGKRSLLEKMPGNEWERFANVRLALASQFLHAGKKLLFMGCEFAMPGEWSHEAGLPWDLKDTPAHGGIWRLVRDLNTLYRGEAALHRYDCEPAGFEWVDCLDNENSVLAFLRVGGPADAPALVVFNFTPVPRLGYRLGVPHGGRWAEVLNSDAPIYGGSGMGNLGGQWAEAVPTHHHPYALTLTLPPLACVVLRPAS